MSKYDFELDMENENSLSMIIGMVKKESIILEFGPANGRMTRYLKENMNCTVDIVEIDIDAGKEAENYSRNSLLGSSDGDIEKFVWCQQLDGNKYDYIIFADVLEHLHNPAKVLSRAKDFLSENGRVLLSVPNIAHNAILLDLMDNNFEYKNVGLLDSTHIHFFAYHNLKKMIKECGYYCVKEAATYCRPENTEFHNSYNHVTKEMKKSLCNKEYGNVYQFVFEIADDKNKTVLHGVNTKCCDRNMDYELSCYFKVDEESEYSETNSKKQFYKPGKNRFVFNFDAYETIKQLRIDPMECNCILDNLVIKEKLSGKMLKILDMNGIWAGEKCIFNTDDPMIIVETPAEKEIVIEFNVEDYESAGIGALYSNEILMKQTIENNETLLKQVIEKQEVLEKEKQKVEDRIVELQGEITKNAKVIDSLEEQLSEKECWIAGKEGIIDDLNVQLRERENVIADLNMQLNAVWNSECWKLTKPLRVVLGKIERNRYFALLQLGIYSLKTCGLRETWNKVKRKLSTQFKKTGNKYLIDSNGQIGIERVELKNVEDIQALNKSIAVHLHLFYIDLLEEFFGYLKNIPFEFDLYVSCKSKTDIATIEKTLRKLKSVNKIVVRETINRGRDIAPFYVQFGDDLSKYDYLLHIHSKKSLFTGREQYGWRQYSLDSLLGSEELVKKVFSLFESDRKIGLFFPETFGNMHLIAQDWLANRQIGQELLSKLGIPFDDGLFNYPVGSFFWVRTEAIRPIFELKLKYKDFPEENGQTDGTLAHALERAVSFVVRNEGYQLAIHDLENGFVSLGKSYKLFQDYLSLDSDAVQYHLSQYALVSFDVFDTLITRCVIKPEDIYKIIESQIFEKYNLKVDFVKLRRCAEQLAWQKKNAWTNIYDIYDELPFVCGEIDEKMSREIMQLEIDAEIKMCVPRRDMLKVFNHVRQNKRKIVLVSDMYLPSDIIAKMLDKCGFEGYDDLWVSCEKGVRKDDGSMWDLFFNTYGTLRTVHVGDNPRSDIQLVGDKRKDTFYVMNPYTAFKLSKYYPLFKEYVGNGLSNSICLGMIINDGLYNSPFSMKSNAEPEISSGTQMGYIGLGVLFSAFIEWLQEKKQTRSQFLFLSREGYFLKKIYEEYLKILNIQSTDDSVYFLTSRRAVSVASIKSWDDVWGILEQFYRGKLSNLLYARLGFRLPDEVPDCELELPRDIKRVMEKIDPYKEMILEQAYREKETYLEYIQKACDREKELTVVDVGYAGTIQYYLMRLLDKPVDGEYLCTLCRKKPEKIGGICEALYESEDEEQQFNSKVYNSQLFLEAVLKAPYGQLLYFKKETNEISPVYKEENEFSPTIENVQNGILQFAKQYWYLKDQLIPSEKMDEKLAEDILFYSMRADWMSKEVEQIFMVEDDYCSNGKLTYNKEKNNWDKK